MIKGIIHTVALSVLLLTVSAAGAQVNVHVRTDRDSILIGEPINLSLEAYVPLGSSVGWPALDTIPHFEVMQRSALDTLENIDGKKLTQQLTITSFDSGRWVLPSFAVSVDTQLYYSDTIPVIVAFTPFDSSEDYHDIKDILEPGNTPVKHMPWLLAAVSLLLLLAIIYIVLLRRKKAATPARAVQKLLSPYEEAIQALNALSPPSQGNEGQKAYYTSMNNVFRRYVSRKFGFSTSDRTNSEIILQIRQLHIPQDAFDNLTRCLRMTDFVKFAKYSATAAENENNFRTIRSSIDILDNHSTSAV